MLFNSFSFLAFLTVQAVIYYALPRRIRWGLLLVASLYFYAAFRVDYVLLLVGVTSAAYLAGKAIAASVDRRRRRLVFGAGVGAVLGALVIFKYFDFAAGVVEDLLRVFGSPQGALPRLGLAAAAGLSFFTFSAVSYLADVYAGRLDAQRHPLRLALYVSFFPKLLAGPIERADPFLKQIARPTAFSAAGVTQGLQLILWGLFKKVVIADRLAIFVDAAYAQPAFSSPADLVLATYFFAFQLYCDFSGYSDIAIGTAKVFGIDLMENFRRPYLSTSVGEFWARRWHLSLASWFRDYLYIPLGGGRCSTARRYINVMTVFMVSGLWHGADWSFVVWGGLNGLYVIVSLATEPLRERLRAVVGRDTGPGRIERGAGLSRTSLLWRAVLTFQLVLVTWVFFRAESLSDAMTIFSRIAASAIELPHLLQARIMGSEILFSMALIALLLAVEAVDELRPIRTRLESRPRYQRWAVYYALLAGLVVFGTWNQLQFVYMQF